MPDQAYGTVSFIGMFATGAATTPVVCWRRVQAVAAAPLVAHI